MCHLKKCVHDSITPLTYLYNSYLKQEIFPDDLKIAKVFHIFKAGDEQLITNYRPISVLNLFLKFLKKLWQTTLSTFWTVTTFTNMALEKVTLLN